jgi:uncharacterized protein YneF (UPF0154 family)
MKKILVFILTLMLLTSCFWKNNDSEIIETWLNSSGTFILDKTDTKEIKENDNITENKIKDDKLEMIKKEEEKELLLIQSQAEEKWKIAEKQNEEFMKKYQK